MSSAERSSPVGASTAEAEYRRRLQRHERRAQKAAQADLRLGAAKLIAFVALLLLAWLWLITHVLAGVWVWVPVAVLVALFVAHDRAIAARAVAERQAEFYRRGLARLEDRWIGIGPSGERFRDPEHPYSDDLDLFGRGSLFELLSRARTPMGEARLAAWMRAPAPAAEVRRRQHWIGAQRDNLDLREQVAALGDELKQKMDPERFAGWSQSQPVLVSALQRWACAALTVAALAALVWGLAGHDLGPFLLLVIAEALLIFSLRAKWSPVLAETGANAEALQLFADLLQRAPVTPHGPRPEAACRALRRLARLADWIEASDSLLGKILDIVVLYSLHLAFAADAWRRRHGAHVQAWLDAVAEFEALLSLASYSYEHPEDVFADVLDGSEPVYYGDSLGHPLLPAAETVRNSVELDHSSRLWIVSGSNMSGKSTWLRTIGLNAVLAQMGAPVRAARLRLSPLALGTRLRTSDSLQQGRSGFYAEILRLRQVFELTRGERPVLFLFDELMEGTNSHDRVIGARGLLRTLLAQRTLGLITTHDLALAALGDELGDTVRNVHFEDQIEGDDVRFDHRLRPGVVTKSNALALMRIIGLQV